MIRKFFKAFVAASLASGVVLCAALFGAWEVRSLVTSRVWRFVLMMVMLLVISVFFITTTFAVVTFSYMREKKRLPPFCRVCSYNLTGNTSGTCPECGTAVAGKAGT